MSNTKDPTSCITCHTKLAPGTEIKYFAQLLLRPNQDDTGFIEEVNLLLRHMRALFDLMGSADYMQMLEEDSPRELGRLGYDLAEEALRRLRLLESAVSHQEDRHYALRKKYGEPEAA